MAGHVMHWGFATGGRTFCGTHRGALTTSVREDFDAERASGGACKRCCVLLDEADARKTALAEASPSARPHSASATTEEACARCDRAISTEEIGKGWPVPTDDGAICPDC